MAAPSVPRRYARALYAEAAAAARVDSVDEDVRVVQSALEGSGELRRLLASALLPRRKKQAVIERLFAGRVDELLVRLLALLVAKGRESMLLDVLRAYLSLRDEQRGEVEAQVRAALPLTADARQRLKARLDAATGRSVRLEIEVDPSLLSGLVVRIGDTVYDGSARHQLRTLREQFAARTFATN